MTIYDTFLVPVIICLHIMDYFLKQMITRNTGSEPSTSHNTLGNVDTDSLERILIYVSKVMALTPVILIIALLAYHHIDGSAKMIKVFETEQNASNFVPNSGALLISEVPSNNVSSVTICFRFLVKQFLMFVVPQVQNLVEFDGKPVFGIYYDFKPPLIQLFNKFLDPDGSWEVPSDITFMVIDSPSFL